MEGGVARPPPILYSAGIPTHVSLAARNVRPRQYKALGCPYEPNMPSMAPGIPEPHVLNQV